jgi:hypothetical protein
MQGYFVCTKEPTSEEDKALLDTVRTSGLIDLKTTRGFNKFTDGKYQAAARSAVVSIHNNTEAARKKRREYYTRPETQARVSKYNKREDVRSRKQLNRQRRTRLLRVLPKEILEKALLDVQKLEFEESEKAKADNKPAS